MTVIDTSKEALAPFIWSLRNEDGREVAASVIEALIAERDKLDGAFNYLMDRMGEIRDLRCRRAATGFPVGVNTDAEFIAHMEKLAEVAMDSATAIRYATPPAPAVSQAAADVLADAERYRWLRARDLDTIHKGGVFAGMTPDNVVLNGEDLDNAVDAARLDPAEREG